MSEELRDDHYTGLLTTALALKKEMRVEESLSIYLDVLAQDFLKVSAPRKD
jgi:hypothetical protein